MTSATSHPDDEFHPPTSDSPWWTETCWFTFTVPERKLSGQCYPFFRPNLGVTSAAVYLWDDSASRPEQVLYAKNFWHLPIPDQPLSDIALANGLSYRCTDSLQRYEIRYTDPDTEGAEGPEIELDLQFDAVARPNYLGESHLDQPGRYTGTIMLRGETIEVDSFGFRDRSWGVRGQFGQGLGGSPAIRGGYTYATASADHGFHILTMKFASDAEEPDNDGIAIHGYLVRDGEWSKLTDGWRRVLRRDPATGCPDEVMVHGTDESGRTFEATGTTLNRIGVHLNPNLFTWNCLTRWDFDGLEVHGEDHDNHSAPAATRHMRATTQP
jgi:hypothetical protein